MKTQPEAVIKAISDLPEGSVGVVHVFEIAFFTNSRDHARIRSDCMRDEFGGKSWVNTFKVDGQFVTLWHNTEHGTTAFWSSQLNPGDLTIKGYDEWNRGRTALLRQICDEATPEGDAKVRMVFGEPDMREYLSPADREFVNKRDKRA